jgi:hypothetical protein
MKKDITELFCCLDDFCAAIDKNMSRKRIGYQKSKTRLPCLFISEIMTIVLLYQQSPLKNFKSFYLILLPLYKNEFPRLPSYNRFIELMPRCFSYLMILMGFLQDKTGKIHFIDATALPVCHNKRSFSHKTFDGSAARGKTTMGWFFGFKLHLCITDTGKIAAFSLTPGNVDDRAPVRDMTGKLKGLLIGDKGYISQNLFDDLFGRGLKFITGVKKNMKNKLMELHEKILLKKRSIIETVFDYLKNKMELLHTRHRSPLNTSVHILATLVAYSINPKKPKVSNKNITP